MHSDEQLAAIWAAEAAHLFADMMMPHGQLYDRDDVIPVIAAAIAPLLVNPPKSWRQDAAEAILRKMDTNGGVN